MNFSEAFDHLRKDEVMSFLIKKLGNQITLTDRYDKDFAKAISLLIIEQQVSFKAAITIKGRFLNLILNKTSKEIINIDDLQMQSIGISHRKVNYIKNTYSYFIKNKIDFKTLDEKGVIKELTQIKGIGKWTAEMFLIFILFKTDVFSKGDLALLNSIKINYSIKDLSNKKLDSFIKKWTPFNTIASLLLWKSIEEKIFFKKTQK
ncbi:MAG: DNA-3-methyladenine glycosylase family protein [Flavobacteriaceae bacterium]